MQLFQCTATYNPEGDMSKILATGGYGDWISLESHFDDEFKSQLTEIGWALRRPDLIPLFERVYPKVQHTVVVNPHLDFAHQLLFVNSNQRMHKSLNDWELPRGFSELLRDRVPRYVGSSLLKIKLCDKPKLPKYYWVIQHDTCHNDPYNRNLRKLDPFDWRGVLHDLDQLNATAVVLGDVGDDEPPKSRRLINLVGQTTVAEAIEIVKGSRGYIGLDSYLASVACQCLDADQLKIKSVNPHHRRWQGVYCAPHKSWEFLYRSLALPGDITKKDLEMVDDRKRIKVVLTKSRLVGSVNRSKGEVIELPEDVAKVWLQAGAVRTLPEYEAQSLADGSLLKEAEAAAKKQKEAEAKKAADEAEAKKKADAEAAKKKAEAEAKKAAELKRAVVAPENKAVTQ
jgi:hypothetical protein